MNTYQKINNKLVVLILSLLLVVLIGFFDFLSGEQLSFSLFYMLPIVILALHHSIKTPHVAICAVFSAILWFSADYSTREYTNVIFPVWNALVRLSIFLSIGLLILYIKKKEQKIALINNNLQVLNEEKNKVIGIAAHDLRSPLGNIYAISEILISENSSDNRLLNMIKSMSQNSMNVLDNLLDVSKIESGKVDLNMTAQDYISFVQGHVTQHQFMAANKKISITFQSALNSQNLTFDQHYLSEVIDNLLSNAIKYSKANTEIVVKVSINDKRLLLTEVIDNGLGIPENEQHRLFGYFQTTSTRPTEGEKSTGLGLAIAKKIITLHKGEIGVSSQVNIGSNFYFTLPLE